MSENINPSFGEVYKQELEARREQLVEKLANEIIEKGILEREIPIKEDFKGTAILETDGQIEIVRVLDKWGEIFGEENFVHMNVKGKEQPIPIDQLKIENPDRETNARQILFENFGFESFQDARDAVNNKNLSSEVRTRAKNAVEIVPRAMEKAFSLDPKLNDRTLMDINEQEEIIPVVLLGVKEENKRILLGERSPFEEQIEEIDRLREAIGRTTNEIARKRATQVLYETINGAYEGLIKNSEPESLEVKTLEILYQNEMARLYEELNPVKNEGSPKRNEEVQKLENRQERYNSREIRHLTETDPIELRNVAREALNYIEGLDDFSNRYRLTGQPTDILDKIMFRLDEELIVGTENDLQVARGENNEDKVNALTEKLRQYDLLRKEIKARLTIFDIGKLMVETGFEISERGGIADAINTAAKMNRELDEEVLSFCYKESGEVGFNIAEAWDLIQEANFNYSKFLKEIYESGLVDVSGYTKDSFVNLDPKLSIVEGQEMGLFVDKGGGDKTRAGIVEKYIIQKLGKNGKKTYQLANELCNATGEMAAFNFNLTNKLSMFIYFKDFRDDDASKGKKVGPYASRGIKSLTHGWLRYFSKSTDLSDKMGPLKAEEIKISESKGKKNSDTFFNKQLTSYALTVANALLDSSPDFSKILNLSWPGGLIGSFNKIDPPYSISFNKKEERWVPDSEGSEKSREGLFKMKTCYVLGLLELVATKHGAGIDEQLILKSESGKKKIEDELERIFASTNLSDSKSFISKEQWHWAVNEPIVYLGKQHLSFNRVLRYYRGMQKGNELATAIIGGLLGSKKR